jgi:hypothetical protein
MTGLAVRIAALLGILVLLAGAGLWWVEQGAAARLATAEETRRDRDARQLARLLELRLAVLAGRARAAAAALAALPPAARGGAIGGTALARDPLVAWAGAVAPGGRLAAPSAPRRDGADVSGSGWAARAAAGALARPLDAGGGAGPEAAVHLALPLRAPDGAALGLLAVALDRRALADWVAAEGRRLGRPARLLPAGAGAAAPAGEARAPVAGEALAGGLGLAVAAGGAREDTAAGPAPAWLAALALAGSALVGFALLRRLAIEPIERQAAAARALAAGESPEIDPGTTGREARILAAALESIRARLEWHEGGLPGAD